LVDTLHWQNNKVKKILSDKNHKTIILLTVKNPIISTAEPKNGRTGRWKQTGCCKKFSFSDTIMAVRAPNR